jgi:chemotaxis protein methyltransferase CheR
MTNTKARVDGREFAYSDADFTFISKLAYEKTGIVLADHKKDMVYSRLTRRLRALNLNTFREYCELVQSPAGVNEVGNLVNAITTNLTSFFREGHHFEHLRDTVLAPFAAGKAGQRLRIWSSACSAGMEPYSIAMTVKHALKTAPHIDAKILATDIDTTMVATSSAGIYTPQDVESVPSEYKQYYDSMAGSKVAMKNTLKELITFKQLNLLHSWPMKGQFDAVFCRNVVIYFDKPTKIELFEKMANYVKPEGYLYIGHSENLNGISDRFEPCGRTIYRRVK